MTRGRPSAMSRRTSLLYRLCMEGREPAESLPTDQRERLVATLYDRGWSDLQIAEHTAMSTYTTARIRTRIRLQRVDRAG